MSELLAAYTALPNLHPALVHLPVALAPVAVLFDLAALGLVRQREWLDRAAVALYLLAAAGAGAAYWSGRRAADGLPLLALEAQQHLSRHANSARNVAWLIAGVAIARLAVAAWDSAGRRLAPRAALLVVALGGSLLLLRTADLGGGLVFTHGVGVDRPEAAAAGMGSDSGRAGSAPEPAEPHARLAAGEDGGLIWKPLPGDRAALGDILRPAAGSRAEAVVWTEPRDGLGLEVGGEAMLLLPGVYGDVQVRAELDLEGFAGEVGLAHHVAEDGRAGLLTLSVPGGKVVLAVREGETHRELARASADPGAGPFGLTVSATGRHLHGYLDGERLVHGHDPPLPDGACGLYLRGRGVVRILSMEVLPGAG